MQVTGMLYGAQMLRFVDFPAAEVLGPAADEEQIKSTDRASRRGLRQAGLPRRRRQEGQGRAARAGEGPRDRARRARAALLRRAPVGHIHRQGQRRDVRGCRPRRARGLLLARRLDPLPRADDDAHAPRRDGHRGARQGARSRRCRSRPLTGHEGVHRRERAVRASTRPTEIVSPLVQHLPNLWELFHEFGMTTLELNPIRMRPERRGRLTPVACDFKCGFDRDDPRVAGGSGCRGRCSRSTTPTSSTRSTSCAPTRGKATSTSSTRTARSSRRPSAVAPTRSSARCSATTRSSRRTSAATRPTRR